MLIFFLERICEPQLLEITNCWDLSLNHIQDVLLYYGFILFLSFENHIYNYIFNITVNIVVGFKGP